MATKENRKVKKGDKLKALFKNLLKLSIPYLIAILSFIGGKYQFNEIIEISKLKFISSFSSFPKQTQVFSSTK